MFWQDRRGRRLAVGLIIFAAGVLHSPVLPAQDARPRGVVVEAVDREDDALRRLALRDNRFKASMKAENNIAA